MNYSNIFCFWQHFLFPSFRGSPQSPFSPKVDTTFCWGNRFLDHQVVMLMKRIISIQKILLSHLYMWEPKCNTSIEDKLEKLTALESSRMKLSGERSALSPGPDPIWYSGYTSGSSGAFRFLGFILGTFTPQNANVAHWVLLQCITEEWYSLRC